MSTLFEKLVFLILILSDKMIIHSGITLILTLLILLVSQIGRIIVDYWITVWTEKRIQSEGWIDSDTYYICEFFIFPCRVNCNFITVIDRQCCQAMRWKLKKIIKYQPTATFKTFTSYPKPPSYHLVTT